MIQDPARLREKLSAAQLSPELREALAKRGAGHLSAELERSAEMLVDLAQRVPTADRLAGVYFVAAFLSDSGYGNEKLKALLRYLELTPGAIQRP